jgi:hypothetical protein
MPERDPDLDLFTLFRRIRAWVDAAYPDHAGVELTVQLPGRRPARIPIPRYGDRRPDQPEATPTRWRPSRDYREVHWHGHFFRFSKAQAAVVELLDQARLQGNPGVDQGLILRQIGSDAGRLIDLFRRGDGARAWNLLIVQDPDQPGAYRLADQPPDDPTE